jgi:hypothetical protein
MNEYAVTPRPKFYRTATSLGLCADVDPYSTDAGILLLQIEPTLTTCDWPSSEYVEQPAKGAHYQHKRCGEEVVRVAIMVSENRESDAKHGSSFVGLCDRHKQMGMWSNADTAWGWD